jgi:hypothetical protein
MGNVVDLTPRLILARKLRGILKEVQMSSLHRARMHMEALEAEVVRQQIVLYNPKATPAQVEEAIYGLPLLHELLEGRKTLLAELQDEIFGNRASD